MLDPQLVKELVSNETLNEARLAESEGEADLRAPTWQTRSAMPLPSFPNFANGVDHLYQTRLTAARSFIETFDKQLLQALPKAWNLNACSDNPTTSFRAKAMRVLRYYELLNRDRALPTYRLENHNNESLFEREGVILISLPDSFESAMVTPLLQPAVAQILSDLTSVSLFP